MVTARHGGLHLEYAREYIKKGIPVWIDKPITCSTQEACEMVELAKEHGCPITGGSGVPLLPEMTQLRENIKSFKDNILGGHVTAPLNMDNPYGGFWFYTQHLVQMMTSVFGTQVRRAEAVKEEKGVSAKYYYDNFNVTAFFGAGYTVTVYTNAYGAAATEVTVAGEFYVPELKEFYNVIKSGKSNMTYNEFIAPVYIIDATIKAFSENKTVELSIPY